MKAKKIGRLVALIAAFAVSATTAFASDYYDRIVKDIKSSKSGERIMIDTDEGSYIPPEVFQALADKTNVTLSVYSESDEDQGYDARWFFLSDDLPDKVDDDGFVPHVTVYDNHSTPVDALMDGTNYARITVDEDDAFPGPARLKCKLPPNMRNPGRKLYVYRYTNGELKQLDIEAVTLSGGYAQLTLDYGGSYVLADAPAGYTGDPMDLQQSVRDEVSETTNPTNNPNTGVWEE